LVTRGQRGHIGRFNVNKKGKSNPSFTVFASCCTVQY
jgi:hypothetical protein